MAGKKRELVEFKNEMGYKTFIDPDSVQAVIVMKENRTKIIVHGYEINVVAPLDYVIKYLGFSENSD